MNKIRPRVRRRMVRSGKVAQFPAIGKVTAAYHTRGVNLLETSGLLSNPDTNERTIHIDKKLVAGVFLDELDEVLAHYELRQEYAEEIGRAMAETDDRQLLQLLAIGARQTTGTTSDHPVGGVLYDDTDGISSASDMILALRVAKQKMDENDVPETGRFAVVRPDYYNALVDESNQFLDKDIQMGMNGGVDAGVIKRVFGMELIWSNNLPSTNITDTTNQHSGEADQNAYNDNFTGTIGVVGHSSSLGTAQRMGTRASVDWIPENQGWMLLGKQAVGHNFLRPEACFEINSAAIDTEFSGAGIDISAATIISA